MTENETIEQNNILVSFALSMSSHEVGLWGCWNLKLQVILEICFPKKIFEMYMFVSFLGRSFLFLGACSRWAFNLELLLATGPGTYLAPYVCWVSPDQRELEDPGAGQLLQAEAAALTGPIVLSGGEPSHLWICCEIAWEGSRELNEQLT